MRLVCDEHSHAAWRATSDGAAVLCVECTLTWLRREPGETLHELIQVSTSRQCLTIHVVAAAKLIATLVNVANSSACPEDLIPLAVQAVSWVIQQLRTQDREEATSALLDTCFQLQDCSGDSRGGKLVSALLDVCLQNKSQRLAAAKSGELRSLLLSPALTSHGRRGVVTFLLENTRPEIELLCSVREKYATDQTPSHLLVLLETMDLLMCSLPCRLPRADNERLLHVTRDILADVKRALMSRDAALQTAGVQCVLTLVLRQDASCTAAVFSADIVEFLVEAINTTHQPLLQFIDELLARGMSPSIQIANTEFPGSFLASPTIIYKHRHIPQGRYLRVLFRCVWVLITSAPTQLYSRGLAGRLLQGLVRALHLVLTQPGAEDVTLGGLTLLATLLIHSQGTQLDLTLHAPQVVALVRQAIQGEDQGVARDAAARVLADLLLVTPRGAALAWPGVTDIVREVSMATCERSPCSCFVLRLVRGAVSAMCGDGDTSLTMLEWAEKAIITHATQCVVKEPINIQAVARLLAALEQLFASPSWQGGPRLSRSLASQGFLALANRLVTEPPLIKRGAGVLANVLHVLVAPALGAALTCQLLCQGLRDLSDPWLSTVSTPRSPECRDASLALCYALVLTSQTPVESCRPLLPGLLSLLRSPVGSAERLPVHAAKAALLLAAVSSHSEAPVWAVPLEVQALSLRWAPAAHLVYTHHPASLRWTIAQSPGAAPLEFLSSWITQWFLKGEKPQSVVELLCAHPSGLPCLLEVVQSSCTEHVASGAALTIQLALPKNSTLREHLWLRLPILLQRVVQPGCHGPALLLQLAAQGLPNERELFSGVVSSLCALLPAFLSRVAMETDPWSVLTVTTGLQVIRVLLPAADSQGVVCFTSHAGFMHTLQTAVNQVTEVTTCTEALRLALQLAALTSDPTPQVEEQTLWVQGSTLIAAIDGVLREPQLALAAIELLAKLPEPAHVEERAARVALRVNLSMVTKFAHTTYKELTYLTAKCTQLGDNDLVDAGWRCLLAVLNWKVSHSLSLFPFTHTLVWTCTPPPCVKAVRSMLVFVRLWVTLQIQEKFGRMTKLRLLSTTVEHLLQTAEQLASHQGCLQLLIDTLNKALEAEEELGTRVVSLTRQKLDELQYMH